MQTGTDFAPAMSCFREQFHHMNQRVLLRFAIGLMLLAGVVLGFQWLRNLGYDPDVLPGDSKDMIAALELTDDGSRTVTIDPSQKVTVIGPEGPSRDRPPLWRPDGQRLFFASDREDSVYHIFRYRPGQPDAERRTLGRRSRSTPTWGFSDDTKANETALILSSGVVLEFNPKTGSTVQLLPPPSGGAVVGEEQGNVDQFTGLYRQLGTSFTKALWTRDRSTIVATMAREGGEVLVVQEMTMRTANGRTSLPPPMPIMGGASIDFDVTSDGRVAVLVRDFQWLDNAAIPEEFIENGRAKVPWRNAIFSFNTADPEAPPSFLAATQNPSEDARSVRISPNGQEAMLVTGRNENDQFEPLALIKTEFPFQPGAPTTPIVQGEVFEPSWRPDGQRILYIRREDGDRAIFSNNGTGTDEARMSPKGRNFSWPVFSPQIGG